MKVRASRAVQGHDLAIDDGIGWKAAQGFCDVRVSLVEVLAIAGVQNRFGACPDAYGAVAIEFDFVGPIRAFGELRNESAFHRLDEISLPFWKSFPASGVASWHRFWLRPMILTETEISTDKSIGQ